MLREVDSAADVGLGWCHNLESELTGDEFHKEGRHNDKASYTRVVKWGAQEEKVVTKLRRRSLRKVKGRKA